MATTDQALVYFRTRLEGRKHASLILPRLVAVYSWFSGAGLSERKFERAIESNSAVEYDQHLSEMLVAYRLHQKGFSLMRSPSSGGPDFVATRDTLNVQIEVYTPLPPQEVEAYLHRPQGGVFTVPLAPFLMCWTKGIAAKANQLLGEGTMAGWRQKKLVDDSAPFVIAINGCLFDAPMEGVSFRQHAGPMPLAAVALYAVSNPTIEFDTNTGQRIWSGYTRRDELTRDKGGPIPLDRFQDPRFAPVSAVWAMALDATDLLYDEPDVLPRQRFASAVLHNANAEVPLGVGELPAFEEWAMQDDPEGYAVTRVLSNLP
jgi:hypothetical protein